MKQSTLRTLAAARRAAKRQADRDRRARLAAYRKTLLRRAVTPMPRVLAEGDSWFDYPRILCTGGGVVDHLHALSGVPVLNMAHHGDPVQETLGVEKRRRLETLLQDPGFDILLFSGGGDDIAGNQFCLWLEPNQGGPVETAVNQPRLREILAIVEDGYRDLIEIRDRLAPECRIVTHSYDFPQPSDDGVCGLGPWLKPSLDYRGWTRRADQFAIVKIILTKLDDLLVTLEREQLAAGKHFLHVRTQGTLNPRKDWDNEIHPNGAGFTKIAKKFSSALNAISPAFPEFP